MRNAIALARAQQHWDALDYDPPEDPVRTALQAENDHLAELVSQQALLINSLLEIGTEAADKLERTSPAGGSRVYRVLNEIREELACIQ